MKNIGIICGGFSSEFDISMQSATNILTNFPANYQANLVVLNRDGWFVKKADELLPLDSKSFTYSDGTQEHKIDVVLIYIHGDPGENGKIQAYLDMIGMPYINTGPLSSELSFDKWFCNQFIKGFGFKVADSEYLTDNRQVDVDKIINRLGLPVFVKPCDSGSSYGIARVNEKSELKPAIDAAFVEGRTVVVEAFLDGTEVTCGVYRTKNGLIALPLTEIISENEFFDYDAKYNGLSQEITPARIPDDVTKRVQEISKSLYTLLQLRSIGRVDFMIVNNEPYIIEVNTIPGFSKASLVPQMIEAAGKTIQEFWTEIFEAELNQ